MYKDTKTTIRREFEFEAAHHLPLHSGKCKQIHGHTFKLAITIEGLINDETGMIMDFGDIDKIVNEKIIDILDHKDLNEIFKIPTSENISQWIFNTLSSFILICKVELWETSKSCAIVEISWKNTLEHLG